MKVAEVLKQLKSLGTAQNRKVFARHGVGENCHGVSYANLNKLRRQIKVDTELAVALWDSGNHDARVLATMVADARELSAKRIDAWAKDLDSYVITDAFAKLVAGSPLARKRSETWMKRKSEWLARAGWVVLNHRLQDLDPDYANDELEALLTTIESDIHGASNRVRDAMNSTLISLGLRNSKLEKKALAVARRIGTVDVDHGETGCKTPDAAEYIARTKAYRASKVKKKAGSQRASGKRKPA